MGLVDRNPGEYQRNQRGLARRGSKPPRFVIDGNGVRRAVGYSRKKSGGIKKALKPLGKAAKQALKDSW